MDATQTEGSVERVPQETLIDMIQSDEREGALTIGTLHDIILSQDGENKLTLQDVFDRLGGSGSSSSEEHRQFSSQTATMATQQMAESAFCSLRERNDLTPEDQSSNKASDKEKLDNPLSFAKSSPERADETADVAPLPESATPAQSDCVAIVTPHEHDVLCCGGRGDFVKQHHAGNQNETKANGRMLCSQGGISIARAKMSGPSIPSITSCSTSMFVEPSKPVSSHITTGPMEMIADLNNMGVELVDSSELHEATQLFRRALSKANDMAFFAGSSARSPIGENSDASKNLHIYQRGEYDEGMHTFSQPIMIDAELASILTGVATILYNLGQVAICTNNNQEACTSFLRALQIFQCGSDCCANSMKALSHAGGVTVVAILSNIGNVLYRAGRFEEAIQTFQKALEVSTSAAAACTHQMLEVSATLNSLGVLFFHLPKANTEKALAYYKESLRIRRNVLGQDAATKEVATTMNNIGRFHYKKGDLDQALCIYSEALTMRRQLFGDDHLDIAAVCYNMGQTLHQKGRLDDAMELYSGFLKIARKRLGCNHRDVAIMLKCIAQIHHERSEFEQACKLYREALQVGEAALGMNHPEIASTLNKLGNLLYESGDTEGAIRVYKEGLKVERAVLSSCHPNIVVTLTNIGQIHKLRGEYHDALRVYKEAVQIQQRNRESSTTDIAATLSAIALIHYQTHSYSKALEVYQEALRIRRDAYGDENLEVASTLNSLGLVLFKMSLYDYALESFHESLRIRHKLLGRDHRDCSVITYNIATIHLDQGNDDEAMPYYRETLRVERAALGHDHADVILTIEHVGRVHQQRGELNDAVRHFKEALELKMAKEQKDHASIAQTFNDLGNVYLQMGRANEMVEAFSHATRHLKQVGQSENELVITGFNFYGLSKLHPEAAATA